MYAYWVPIKPKGEPVFGELISMGLLPDVPERPTPPGNGNGELPPPVNNGKLVAQYPWPADTPAPTPDASWTPILLKEKGDAYPKQALVGPYVEHNK